MPHLIKVTMVIADMERKKERKKEREKKEKFQHPARCEPTTAVSILSLTQPCKPLCSALTYQSCICSSTRAEATCLVGPTSCRRRSGWAKASCRRRPRWRSSVPWSRWLLPPSGVPGMTRWVLEALLFPHSTVLSLLPESLEAYTLMVSKIYRFIERLCLQLPEPCWCSCRY